LHIHLPWSQALTGRSIAETPGNFQGFFLTGINAYLFLLAAFTLKTDYAVNQSKKGIVFANSNVQARVDLGTALAHQDVAGLNKLAVLSLYSQAFGLTIAAVPGTTYTFFMGKKL
jgi:hypothetical protein